MFNKRTQLEQQPIRYALVSPALLSIAVFLFIPIAIVATYSFLEPGTYGGVKWNLSFDAYKQFLFEADFLTDELQFTSAYLEIFSRSFGQAFTATVLCLFIGFPTAYFIATRPQKTQSIWLFAITIPYWVNLLIRTVSMLFIIRDQGPINELLMSLGWISEPIKMAYTPFAVALGLFYSYLPFMVLPIYTALSRFDMGLLTAAHDLYASKWAALRHVLIPNVTHGITAGCLLVFIPSIGAFIAPDMLGGGKQLMIGNLIALQFQSSRNWPFGAATSMILLTFVLIVLIAFALKNKGGKK